jgi:hypothetical protein
VGFVLHGMKPAAAQDAEWWQGAVLIIPPLFKNNDEGRD